MMKKKIKLKYMEPEYIHSSNALFHFMKEIDHLKDALQYKRLSPRYCEEDIEYLNLTNEGEIIKKANILQKCFCDIPLHKITKKFSLQILDVEDNKISGIKEKLNEKSTHMDFYGKYGIAFSKKWCLTKNMQPVQYLNEESSVVKQYKTAFDYILQQENMADEIVDDILSRIAYFKPLYGKMSRVINNKTVMVQKNFHDECEWRFTPENSKLSAVNMNAVIFDLETQKLSDGISKSLQDIKYSDLWLKFNYEDIKYLIVPDVNSRKELIDFIMSLSMKVEKDKKENTNTQNQCMLISKILVLDEIEKDW